MEKQSHKTGLFIGRFQPFHLGHLDIVKKILKENDKIIIAIGSAEKSHTSENPLTAKERIKIIQETLKKLKINPNRYSIIPIKDIDDHKNWVKHVDKIVPFYDSIYTGSEVVKSCYQLANLDNKLIQIQHNRPISATNLRKSIIEKTPNWEKMVHPFTAKLLKELGLYSRLKKITKTSN